MCKRLVSNLLTRLLWLAAQEVLDWLSRPENLQADSLPPFIENFDAVPYIISALPISGSVLGINVLHEVVQRTVAATKQVCLLPIFPPMLASALHPERYS